MDEYPDSKVILTVRNEDSWIKSWNTLNNKIQKQKKRLEILKKS